MRAICSLPEPFPFIFVIDDLHWVAEQSMSLLTKLIHSPEISALFIYSHRPTEKSPSYSVQHFYQSLKELSTPTKCIRLTGLNKEETSHQSISEYNRRDSLATVQGSIFGAHLLIFNTFPSTDDYESEVELMKAPISMIGSYHMQMMKALLIMNRFDNAVKHFQAFRNILPGNRGLSSFYEFLGRYDYVTTCPNKSRRDSTIFEHLSKSFWPSACLFTSGIKTMGRKRDY